MKIAIVAQGFTGATLPLARDLEILGHEVECLYIIPFSRKRRCIEGLNYYGVFLAPGIKSSIPKSNSIYHGFLGKNTKIALFPILRSSNKLLNSIFTSLNRSFARHIAKYVISSSFDAVNLVIHTELECEIMDIIKKHTRTVCSMHEVAENLNESTPKLSKAAQRVAKSDIPVIVHSEVVKKNFVANSNIPTTRIHVIRFGSFDSYLFCRVEKPKSQLLNPAIKKYMLYFGGIQAYKGVGILYEASLKTQSDIHIVVAGGGSDPAIAKMKDLNRFTVINRFLENDELIHLISGAEAIICPYLNASQSGVFSTAMAFGKPVIASDVGAFKEVIQHRRNGYIFSAKGVSDLARTIDDVIEKIDEYQEICSNILYEQEHSWDGVATTYLNILTQPGMDKG